MSQRSSKHRFPLMGTPASVNMEEETVGNLPGADLHEKSESEKRIEEILERFIANKKIENRSIPNFVEKDFYRILLTTIIGVLQEGANQTSLEFLGHRFTFQVEAMTTPHTSKDVVSHALLDTVSCEVKKDGPSCARTREIPDHVSNVPNLSNFFAISCTGCFCLLYSCWYGIISFYT